MKIKAGWLNLFAVALISACASTTVEQVPIDADELRALIVGNTLSGSTAKRAQFVVYFREDGTASATWAETPSIGSWEITADGQLCSRFSGWDLSAWKGDRRVCHVFFKAGSVYNYYEAGNLAGTINVVSRGNPRRL